MGLGCVGAGVGFFSSSSALRAANQMDAESAFIQQGNPDAMAKYAGQPSNEPYNIYSLANEYGIPVFPLDWEQTDDKGAKNMNTGFKGKGYESDAIVNFLCLLGWSPGDNREIMSMDELVVFKVDLVD